MRGDELTRDEVRVRVVDDADAVCELGPAAREALHGEQVDVLSSALDALATVGVDWLDRRDRLEEVGRLLDDAAAASSMLWHLAPADTDVVDEGDRAEGDR